MKTLTIIALMVCASATIQAKKIKDVTVLYDGPHYWMPCPQMDIDKETGDSTVIWRSSEDRHVEGRDGVWVKNVPLRTIPPIHEEYRYSRDMKDGLVPLNFQLTEEEGFTVLHCYMRMPATSVSNFWLASDETAIVDRETGAHYRAIRCEPADAWYKYFKFTAPKDSTIDFKIYFPRLLPSTKTVSIYGVPNWHLRGEIEWNIRGLQYFATMKGFDQKPEMHHPTLVRPAHDYNKNNSNSWSVYTDAHLIKPLKEGTKALWLTPEATYVAVAHEQNWLREYMGVEKGGMLLDGYGHQYKLKGLVDYPLGEIYWVEGYSGDFLATFKVFEPLPLGIETITYVEPDGEPFSAWGANWKGSVESNLSVEELRFNQRFFEYKKRDIIIQ